VSRKLIQVLLPDHLSARGLVLWLKRSMTYSCGSLQGQFWRVLGRSSRVNFHPDRYSDMTHRERGCARTREAVLSRYPAHTRGRDSSRRPQLRNRQTVFHALGFGVARRPKGHTPSRSTRRLLVMGRIADLIPWASAGLTSTAEFAPALERKPGDIDRSPNFRTGLLGAVQRVPRLTEGRSVHMHYRACRVVVDPR
jgi:hypothetical protein